MKIAIRNALMELPTISIVGQLEITDYTNNATLERYAGQNQLREGFIINITKEGKQLKAQLSNCDTFDIFPDEKNLYFPKVGEIQFTLSIN